MWVQPDSWHLLDSQQEFYKLIHILFQTVLTDSIEFVLSCPPLPFQPCPYLCALHAVSFLLTREVTTRSNGGADAAAGLQGTDCLGIYLASAGDPWCYNLNLELARLTVKSLLSKPTLGTDILPSFSQEVTKVQPLCLNVFHDSHIWRRILKKAFTRMCSQLRYTLTGTSDHVSGEDVSKHHQFLCFETAMQAGNKCHTPIASCSFPLSLQSTKHC